MNATTLETEREQIKQLSAQAIAFRNEQQEIQRNSVQAIQQARDQGKEMLDQYIERSKIQHQQELANMKARHESEI